MLTTIAMIPLPESCRNYTKAVIEPHLLLGAALQTVDSIFASREPGEISSNLLANFSTVLSLLAYAKGVPPVPSVFDFLPPL